MGIRSEEHPIVLCDVKAVMPFDSVDTTLLPSAFPLLGTFPTLREVTVSCVMSVRPSVCIEQLGSYSTDVREI
jgi:hypothetical protein